MRFVQHHITTTNFYSSGRIGEFAKSEGRDEVEEDAGYDAERDLRGLHFQVTDSHTAVGYGLTMKFRMYACLRCSTRRRGRRSSASDLRRMRRAKATTHKTGNPKSGLSRSDTYSWLRGHCTFYEDLKGPLYQNNFLFSLSMLLARMPFRDYQSSDRKELLQKLLDIEIREAQRFAAKAPALIDRRRAAYSSSAAKIPQRG